jgi:hypothetical protein
MKPFKVVWLKTETLEAKLDSIKGIRDADFINNIPNETTINSVVGALRIYRGDGTQYVPYTHE